MSETTYFVPQWYDEDIFEPKWLCVLVLDTSDSMNANGTIDDLNKGLQAFKNVTMQHCVRENGLEVAIVSFNSKVDVVQEASILPNVEMPTLEASGHSQLVAAIEKAQEVVKQRKDYYKSKGIPYHRPWIVVMIDGDPYPTGQDIDGIAAKVQDDADNNKYVFFVIGIGDEVQDATLTTLAAKQWPAARMAEGKFAEFFTWLSDVIFSPMGMPDVECCEFLTQLSNKISETTNTTPESNVSTPDSTGGFYKFNFTIK